MNCVQRRIFQAFVKSGGDPKNPAQYAALLRFVHALVLTLPDKVGQVVDLMLRGDEKTTDRRVARRLRMSETAARQFGYRGVRQLQEMLQHHEWQKPRWRTTVRRAVEAWPR
jgi:hypothetical protein